MHENIAEKFIPMIIKELKEKKVEIRGDEIFVNAGAVPASEEDWGTAVSYTHLSQYFLSASYNTLSSANSSPSSPRYIVIVVPCSVLVPGSIS